MKNKHKYILLTTVLIIVFFTNLLWLSCIVVLFVFVSKLGHYLLNKINNRHLQKVSKTVFSFFIILTIAVLTRLFVVDVYSVPSESMENTLYKGDLILVNKLKYGPLLPRSPYEIPWVNILYLLKENSKDAVQKKVWDNRRFSGFSEVENGDVLVFKKHESTTLFVKRCVAKAGDDFEIKNGEIYIDNKHQSLSTNINNFYYFKVNDILEFSKEKETLNFDFDFQKKKQYNWFRAHLSYREASLIKELKSVDTIHKKIEPYKAGNGIFPSHLNTHWTVDNYGPIKIPKKNILVDLKNKKDFVFYQHPIRSHENNEITISKDILYLKGIALDSYQFSQDYYFMMGDNRKKSKDSRFFGFIPKNKVIGNVVCVLFSTKDNKFQWRRLFKFL